MTIPAERNVTQKGEEKKLIQQFMYRYKTNVKYQMYNYTCNKLSHWNSNKILKKLDPVPGKHLIDLAMLGTSQIIRQVLQSEALRLSGGDHGWFKRRTEEKRSVTRDRIIITRIIAIMLLQPGSLLIYTSVNSTLLMN